MSFKNVVMLLANRQQMPNTQPHIQLNLIFTFTFHTPQMKLEAEIHLLSQPQTSLITLPGTLLEVLNHVKVGL